MRIKILILIISSFFTAPSICEDIDANSIGFNEDRTDDTEKVIQNIKFSLPQGLVSLEQVSGKLLFNPQLKEMKQKQMNAKFFLPAMVVSQKKGLRLEAETPMVCFLMSAGSLGEEEYKNYRQYTTLKYIQDVKQFNVEKVLICDISTIKLSEWRQKLRLDTTGKPFKFDEHTSINDEHFYYYLDDNGSFEMYI